jgi:uncharacterized protein
MKNDLNHLIKNAMISGNKVELSVFRFIKNEFTKFETAENAKELTDEIEQRILTKMIKEREDSIKMFCAGNRNDLADTEREEMMVIKHYLPKEPTEDEIKSYIEKLLLNKSGENMGTYIKEVKTRYPTANGKIIADIVKEMMNK